MKKLIFRIGFLAVFLQSLTALAQMPGAGMNSAMVKLFGDNMAFTARCDVQVMNSSRQVWLQMPTALAAADTKMRIDVDLGMIHSAAVPADKVNYYKHLGMDKVTSVTRPDKKSMFFIYPGTQSYVVAPLAAEDAQVQKLEKKPLGKETIDGHACVKNLSVVKNAKGSPLLQAVTWNATDLKDFPVRIETVEGGNTTVMHFQQVNLTKPDPRLFDPPANYKQYSNPSDLEAAANKKAGAGGATPGGAAKAGGAKK